MSSEVSPRRLGSTKEAAAIVGVVPSTVRSWGRQGLIHAVRVGNGPFLFDLDEVAAMKVEYPNSVDERIRELAAAAPEFSAKQINQLRLLLHAGVGAPQDGAA
jgi:MerR HTH family regulatory protein